MNSDRFARLKQLLLQVADLPESDRQRILREECRNDPELRDEIESLLVHEEDQHAILQTAGGIHALGSPARDDQAAPELRRHIAGYRIIHRLGVGGMGEVFLAEQEHPIRRRVALKVIKLGMDTKEVVARFESERQALAMMNHPNIANVFDAGSTEDGRPYFVMELVAGLPITEYCDRHHLGIAERLNLFVPVCQAIQHAHERGIIHRDLKPSNLLVTLQDGKPVAKVIDFGVAKATNQRLTERTIYTEQGLLIGTPEYMSPEQAEMTGLDVDTRTDIYSLGVVLYELLVGVLPFDAQMLRESGLEEMRRIIRETDPQRPSSRVTILGKAGDSLARQRGMELDSLARELRGDLDWIILKAMAKDRTHRYSTSEEFATDIRCHLGGGTVVARPTPVGYRLGKAVRRRRGVLLGAIMTSVPAAAILVIVVLTTLGRLKRGDLLAVEVFQTDNARALSDHGEVLWARRLNGRIVPNGDVAVENPHPYTIVERKGRPIGVMLSTYTVTGPDSLWFLDARTGRTIWSRESRWEAKPINVQFPPYYEWNALIHWPRMDEPVLAAGLRDGGWYLFAVEFITLSNTLLGCYYHPGPLSFGDEVWIEKDTPSVLLFGCNSSARFVSDFVPFDTPNHPGCVIRLDLPAVDGQAFPYSRNTAPGRDWPGMKRASERSYLLIPPIHPTLPARVTSLLLARDAAKRIQVQAYLMDGRIITLDSELRPLGCFLPSNSSSYEMNRKREAVFLPYILIRRGVEERVKVSVSFD